MRPPFIRIRGDDENKINHLCCSSRDCASDDRGKPHERANEAKNRTGAALLGKGKEADVKSGAEFNMIFNRNLVLPEYKGAN